MAQFDINTYSTTQMHFEQQLEYIPQGLAWLASVLEAHVTGNMKACYYVVHDKDTNTDEENNTHPLPHVHIAVQFHSSVKVMSVLKWFGWEDKPQLFHKAAEKSRFGSLVSYLTHRTPRIPISSSIPRKLWLLLRVSRTRKPWNVSRERYSVRNV